MKTLNAIALGCAVLALAAGSAIAQSNSTVTKELILKTGTYNSLFQTGAQSSNYTYTLPITTPTANQVLTATGVSGTNVTFGWSSAGGGGGVTYGPGSTQATLNDRSVRLFDVSYQSGAGAAVGARIQSGSTDLAATGLTVSAIGNTSANGLSVSATGTTGNTAVGGTFTATGGTNNYALVVPASSGNVGIGNSAPSALLSVGSSSQFQVDASGNTTLASPGATPPVLRFNEPSAGADYSSFTTAAQSATIRYVLPTAQPGGANRALVVSSISGAGPYDVNLGWSSAAPGTGNSTKSFVRLTGDLTNASNTTWVDAFTFTAAAGVSQFDGLVFFDASSGNNQTVRFRLFCTDASTTNTFAMVEVDANSSSSTPYLEQGEDAEYLTKAFPSASPTCLYFYGSVNSPSGGTYTFQFRRNTSGSAILKAGSFFTVIK